MSAQPTLELNPEVTRALRPPEPATPAKKKLIRRTDKDYSQQLRRTFQAFFILLNIWIGVEFYAFVRHYETAGQTPWAARPDGVEGYLPIAALMNLKAFILTRTIPEVHPAGMFLLIAFLAISVIFRKAFCGWLCPVGTLSEYIWKAGRRLMGTNFRIWKWLDIPLRGLKYLLLGFFLYAVVTMSVPDIRAFLNSPYGVIADVKMLNFFRFLGGTGLAVITILVALSFLYQNFWCRYLCPYGALMGFASLLSPLRITRNEQTCIDCAKCAKACPSSLPVDKLIQIRSAECIGCMECVAVCPAEGALQMATVTKKPVPVWAMAAGVAIIFFGVIGYAKLSGHWTTEVPREVYMRLVPNADQATHPMPGRPQ